MRTLFERPFVKKSILVAGIAVGLYTVITWFVPLVIPFLIAFMLAAMMQPVIRLFVNRLQMRYRLAFVLTAVLFAAVLCGVLLISAKELVSQTRNIITSYPFYQAKLLDGLHICCGRIDGWFQFGEGVSYTYFTTMLAGLASTVSDNFLPHLTTGSVRAFVVFFNAMVFLFVTGIATLLLAKHYPLMGQRLTQSRAGQFVLSCGHNLYLALSAYLRAQVVIMLSNAVVLSVLFWLIGTPYYIVIGILVAVLDALPFVGSGLILIPWALVLVFMGHTVQAVYVVIGYLICTCIREVMEPKLIGVRIGISTLTSLICMYVGLKLFGILGFLFGPVAFLVGKEMYQVIWKECEG